jgi:hypothetical protein
MKHSHEIQENGMSLHHLRWASSLLCGLALSLSAQTTILQPLSDKPVPGAQVKLKSDFYVPATPETHSVGLSAQQRSQAYSQCAFRFGSDF